MALLRLACWCCQRAAESHCSIDQPKQGGSPWQQSSPPRPTNPLLELGDWRAVGTTVDTAAGEAAAGIAWPSDAVVAQRLAPPDGEEVADE